VLSSEVRIFLSQYHLTQASSDFRFYCRHVIRVRGPMGCGVPKRRQVQGGIRSLTCRLETPYLMGSRIVGTNGTRQVNGGWCRRASRYCGTWKTLTTECGLHQLIIPMFRRIGGRHENHRLLVTREKLSRLGLSIIRPCLTSVEVSALSEVVHPLRVFSGSSYGMLSGCAKFW
jgi:hypothetical protein